MQLPKQKWMWSLISYWDRNAWLATNVIVIASIIIARLSNENIAYGNSLGCDYWYFFGLYQDYFRLRSMLHLMGYDPSQLRRFPAILPWIFLGPRISVVALTEAKFWTYLLISCVSFSYSAIALFGARIGPLISILFLGCTLFVGALSTDYVTGAGLAWECAFIATLVQAAKSERSVLWLILAGIFCACGIYTHIPMAMFIFSAPLYLFLRTPKPTAKYLTRSVILMMIGFLVTTIALCIASLLMNGDFLFFKKELLSALSYVGSANAYPGRPQTDTLQWFSYDANIPVFLLAAAASILTLIRLRLQRATPAFPKIAIPAIIYLAVAVLCFSWEFSGRMVLQENVVAPWMLPSAFLAIGSALFLVKLPDRALSIGLCMAAAVVLVWAASRINPDIGYRWRYILAASALLSLALPFRAWSTTLAAGAILALLAIDYPTGYGSQVWWANWNGKALYKLVQRAHLFITARAGDNIPRFWIGGDVEYLGDPLLVSIATPRSFFQCRAFPASFPNVQVNRESEDQYFPDLPTAVRDHYVLPGQRLFIIGRGHDLVSQAEQALDSVGLSAMPLDETEITPSISIAVAGIEKARPATADEKP